MAGPLRPSKIVCVGKNYVAHAAEMGGEVPEEPLLFLKAPSALIASGQAVQVPPDVGRVDYEGEIALVVGRRTRRVSEDDAWGCISHIAALNDVTARTLQRKDNQWSRAKGLDTFCPVGTLAPSADVDWEGLVVVTRVNGEERQRGAATDMAFSIPTLVSYISHLMTLEEGDIIATGTPEGVGPIVPGDVVEVEVLGQSTVTTPVSAAEPIGLAP